MNIPVVIGQHTFALLSRASRARISDAVMSEPFPALRMSASTSSGFGISIVPRPNLFSILGGI
jgi:hypothetical protein